jgi:hypothetical protein
MSNKNVKLFPACIEWEDPMSCQGWLNMDCAREMTPQTQVSVGIVLRMDKDYIHLTTSTNKGMCDRCSDLLMIPRGCVKKMRRLTWTALGLTPADMTYIVDTN